MQRYINKYQRYVQDLLARLRDVGFLGQVLFGVIVLLISWSGVKVVQTNYALQKQISVLQQQNAVQQLANNNLELQNQYYNTNQYLELSARQNFGLADPGETEVLVPKSVALANTVPVPADSSGQSSAKHATPGYQHNLKAWLSFFLHYSTTI